MLREIFYGMVLPNSIAGVVFVLLILAFRQATGRWTKKYMRIMWLLLLVQLLAPPLFHSSFYTVRDLGAAMEHTEKETVQKDGSEGGVLLPEGSLPDKDMFSAQTVLLQKVRNQSIQVSAPEGQDKLFSWKGPAGVLDGIVFIWISGTVVLLLIYVMQYGALKRKVAGAVCEVEQNVYQSARITVPFVMPDIPPRIYLPQGLTEVQRADVLLHERQHIRNGDPLIKCIALGAAAVYWFHPFVWVAVLMLGKDMEMYCDECAMRGKSLEERKAYSGTLLEFAAASGGPLFTMSFAKSNIERRIQHILYRKRPHLLVSILLTVFVAASGIVFLASKDVQGSAGEENDQREENVFADRETEPVQEELRPDIQGDYLNAYREDILESWQRLAKEHGMTEEEAEEWYGRFVQDGICETGYNHHVTGCAYEDFDGNGRKDLFLVLSLSPNEIYQDSVAYVMYVCGYVNGRLVYQRGFDEFSRDGFLECTAKKSREQGVSFELLYMIDTDSLEEKYYQITFSEEGNILSEQCLTETEEIMGMLKNISVDEYDGAVPYDISRQKAAGENRVVLLDENQSEGIRVFGYESDVYGARGMVIDYNGTFSYFDFTWDAWRMKPEIYIGDFDGDSSEEIALIYLAGAGTGMYAEGLRIFEVQKDHTLLGCEMPEQPEFFWEQMEDAIRFDRDRGIVEIVKDGEVKQEIDFSAVSEYRGNEENVELVYNTFVGIEITGDHIVIKAEVMLGWLSTPLTYMEAPEDNTVEIDVIYRDGSFYLQIA